MTSPAFKTAVASIVAFGAFATSSSADARVGGATGVDTSDVVTAYFDGKPINERLANRLARVQHVELLRWNTCPDGTATGARDECIVLTVGTDESHNVLRLTSSPCDDSTNEACFAGYFIDERHTVAISYPSTGEVHIVTDLYLHVTLPTLAGGSSDSLQRYATTEFLGETWSTGWSYEALVYNADDELVDYLGASMYTSGEMECTDVATEMQDMYIAAMSFESAFSETLLDIGCTFLTWTMEVSASADGQSVSIGSDSNNFAEHYDSCVNAREDIAEDTASEIWENSTDVYAAGTEDCEGASEDCMESGTYMSNVEVEGICYTVTYQCDQSACTCTPTDVAYCD